MTAGNASDPILIDGRKYTQIGERWKIETGTASYLVDPGSDPPTCSCPAGQFRRRCRHVAAVLTLCTGIQEGDSQR